MTDQEIRRLREMANAALGGPWGVGQRAPGEWEVVLPIDHASIAGVPVAGVYGTLKRKETAAFIAAARTAVPALLDELERLRTDLGKYQSGRLVSPMATVWQQARQAEAQVLKLRGRVAAAMGKPASASIEELLGKEEG